MTATTSSRRRNTNIQSVSAKDLTRKRNADTKVVESSGGSGVSPKQVEELNVVSLPYEFTETGFHIDPREGLQLTVAKQTAFAVLNAVSPIRRLINTGVVLGYIPSKFELPSLEAISTHPAEPCHDTSEEITTEEAIVQDLASVFSMLNEDNSKLSAISVIAIAARLNAFVTDVTVSMMSIYNERSVVEEVSESKFSDSTPVRLQQVGEQVHSILLEMRENAHRIEAITQSISQVDNTFTDGVLDPIDDLLSLSQTPTNLHELFVKFQHVLNVYFGHLDYVTQVNEAAMF